MVRLTTPVIPEPIASPLSLGDSLFFIGSCFSQEVSNHFHQHFYPVCTNPWGVVYHPCALAEQLQSTNAKSEARLDDIEKVGELYTHDLFHGDYAAPSKEQTRELIAEAYQYAQTGLSKASHVVITLGTAFGYVRKSTGKVVANCHKRPADDFTRRLFTADEIVENMVPILYELQKAGKKVVLTVSPVRHVRDSLPQNQLSKAQLVTTVHQLQQKMPDISYFPAYEILLDELRDYRFYAKDLAHPNETATQIIFERFCAWVFGGDIPAYFSQADRLARELNHRSRYPETAAGQQFAAKRMANQKDFLQRFPFAQMPSQ